MLIPSVLTTMYFWYWNLIQKINDKLLNLVVWQIYWASWLYHWSFIECVLHKGTWCLIQKYGKWHHNTHIHIYRSFLMKIEMKVLCCLQTTVLLTQNFNSTFISLLNYGNTCTGIYIHSSHDSTQQKILLPIIHCNLLLWP